MSPIKPLSGPHIPPPNAVPVRQRPPAESGQGVAPDSQPAPDLQAARSPQQLLNQQILGAIDGLNDFLVQRGAAPVEHLVAEDFTPEKVAQRILGFIRAGINRARADGADEGQLGQMLEQARAGIESGFAEAVELLSGLGLYQDKIQDDAEQTLALLRAGLDEQTNPGESEPSAPQPGEG